VPSKALVILAAIPLIVQLVGCASLPAQSGADAPTAAAKPEEKKSTPPVNKEAKGFAEDIQRGDAAWQAQDLDRAIYYYVQAMEKSPHDATTLAKIGTIEDSRGNSTLAGMAFEMAHNADPQEPRIAERLARLYLRGGNVERAAALYTQVLALDPHRARALDGMGEVCLTRSDYVQSVSYFDRALTAEKPDAAAVLAHRGYAKLRINDLAGAETDLRAALTIAPREDAWRYLGDLQVRRGDTGAALDSLLNFMDTAQAYNEIGVVFMNMGNYSDAREYFAKAIKASASWFEEAQKNLALADEYLRKSAG
jgi:tetratricopeptide (TPR) repeat protein